MKLVRRFVLVFALVIVTASIGGAYATFTYPAFDTPDLSVNNYLSLSHFEFSPDEVLPGGSGSGGAGGSSDIPVEVGQDHMELIENILNHRSYGLNATKKPIIHNVLNIDDNVIYCDQNVQGGNLKHLAIDQSDNAQRLYFVVHRISATEYHTYTMLASDTKKTEGSYIEVYRTVMVKGENKVWTAPYSQKGKAKVYDPGSIVDQAIDVHSFIDDRA